MPELGMAIGLLRACGIVRGGNVLESNVAMRSFTGLTVITVVFLVAASLLIACNRTVPRKARHAFLLCLGVLTILALIDWFVYYTNGIMPELRSLHILLVFITFSIAPFLPVFIAQTIHPVRSVKWIIALLLVHVAIEVVNIFDGFVFWVDETNLYHRGPLYSVYMAAFFIAAIYLVVQTIRVGRAYQTVQSIVIFGILACMFSGVIMQIFDIDVRMTWPAASMAVILYFLFYSDMVLRTDALTKLLNRRSFEDALEHPTFPCIAVIIDVDNFKNVNDTYGHAYGDKCLKSLAQMIRRSFGGAGLCYRTGGDEFAVIMTKRLDDVEQLSGDLKHHVAEMKREDSRLPGVSIGYAPASATGSDIHEAFRIADQSMYEAKWTERN